MAENSGGGLVSSELFEFEVTVCARSKDETKTDNAILTRELKHSLSTKDLQNHLTEHTKLKNFVITGIKEVSPKDCSIIILFAVRKKNEWEQFKKVYHDQLPKGIKSYLDSSFRDSSSRDNSKLDLSVNLDTSKVSEKAIEFFESTSGSKTESEYGGNTLQNVMSNEQPCKQTEIKAISLEETPEQHGKLEQEIKSINLEDNTEKHGMEIKSIGLEETPEQHHGMISRTFAVYIQKDKKCKRLNIVIVSDCAYLNKIILHQVPGFDVWKADVLMPTDENDFWYAFQINYKMDLGLWSTFTNKVRGSTNDFVDNTSKFCVTKDEPMHVFQIFFANLHSKERAIAYAEICSVIILSTSDLNIAETIETLKCFQRQEGITDRSYMQHIAIEVQSHIKNEIYSSAKALAFLCFLSHFQSNSVAIVCQGSLNKAFVKDILITCGKLSLKDIPLMHENVDIPHILMNMYIGCFLNDGSFIGFMFYMNTFLTEEQMFNLLCTYISKQRSSLKVFNPMESGASSSLTSVLRNLEKRISCLSHTKHGINLLTSILRQIPFEELLKFMCDSQNFTAFKEIDLLECEEVFLMKLKNEMQMKMNLHSLCKLFITIRKFSFSQNPKEIVEKMENSLLNAVQQESTYQIEPLKSVFLSDGEDISLFETTDKQLLLLMTLAKSTTVVYHKLFVELMDSEKYGDIPVKNGKQILEQWFDTARKSYCESYKSPLFIPKMYSFLSNVAKTIYVKCHPDVEEALSSMAFASLSNFKLVDILINTSEIEKLHDSVAEEMYLGHIQTIIQRNNDISLNDLVRNISGTSYLRVDSRVTYGMCLTLMSVSGLDQNMSNNKAFTFIVGQADFWISILQATGGKKDELLEETLLKKVIAVIKNIADEILTDRVSLFFLDCYEKKEKQCCNLINSATSGRFSQIKVKLQNSLQVIRKFKRQLDRAVSIIDDVLMYIREDPIHTALATVKTYFIKQKKELSEKDVTICDIRETTAFKLWLPQMEAPIMHLRRVIKSIFFWNCVKLTYDFSDVKFLNGENTSLMYETKKIKDNEDLSNENTLQGIPVEQFDITCKLLMFLQNNGIDIYEHYWSGVYKGDISIINVQKCFTNTDRHFEIKLAMECLLMPLVGNVEESINSFFEYRKYEENVTAIKMTMDSFKLDVSSDSTFKQAVRAFDQLCKKDVGSLSLNDVHSAIETVKSVTNYISEDIFNVLMELGRSSSLIDFLREVLNDDIRNLIDAVEEHSEQYVRESTVLGLIEVKRVLQSILKENLGNDIKKFIELLGKSINNCRVKNLPGKICDCMENIHSLRTLYINVTNKGENTKELIQQILTTAVFVICLENEKPVIQAEYKIEGKMFRHSTQRLNDLRSRALLMMNTVEKQESDIGSPSKKSENLIEFVKAVDTLLDISNTYYNLRKAGHFDFLVYNKKMKLQELEHTCTNLHETYYNWVKMLQNCRDQYYYMNYIHSSHLQILYMFLKSGHDFTSVLNILKFINPKTSLTTLKEIRTLFQEYPDASDLGTKLTYMGKVIQSKFESMPHVTRKFQNTRKNKKITDIVLEGKLHVVVENSNHLLLQTLLALYINTTQLLPESNQVIFCSKETTEDEIMLLISRCIDAHKHGLDKRLFSIVNIDLLSTELCFRVVDALRQLSPNDPFLLVLIIGGNYSGTLFDEFADKIMPVRHLTDNEMKECFESQWPDVLTITSDIPGLGKTEQMHKIASQKRKSVVTLHLSGPFVKSDIVRGLLNMKIKPYHLLHVDIGVVDDPLSLDLFLFELVAFGYVSSGSSSFARSTDNICIEVANSVKNTLMDSLSTVNYFQRRILHWENYNDMKISCEINSPVQVVCHYLQSLKRNELDKRDKYFSGPRKETALSEAECRMLLKEHFSSSVDMSFTLVNVFIYVLSDQLKKMSTSIFFRQSNIASMIGDKEIPTVKTNLTEALVDVSKEFARRSINTCRSTQLAALAMERKKEDVQGGGKRSIAEVLASRVEGMIHWEDSNHLMILFHQDLQTVSALFRDQSKVPNNVKTFFKSQMKKPLPDLGKYSSSELQNMLIKLTRNVRVPINQTELKRLDANYALTPDNLLKMVLISLRVKAHIPVVIMGETGCGKTSLVRYLANISGVVFDVLSIHAGVTNTNIVQRVRETNERASEKLEIPHWLFLDEINTCDHLGLINDVICHHKCMGKPLAPNLTVLAACNPYRLRSENAFLSAGLQGKVHQDKLSRLVYRVHPLPETMVDFVWDYGRLGDQDEYKYIQRMIGDTLKNQELSTLFVSLLSVSQTFVREKEETDYSVSLRDVERCRRLLCWFIEILERKKKLGIDYIGETKERAIILALGLCYHSRFPNSERRRQYRKVISDVFNKHNRNINETNIRKTISEEQNDILNRMDVPEGTARNIALQENVFVILVCILNKIPVFVVGKPGCSKSLSMQLIRSNLRGKDSRDNFFKTLPQLYCVSFQGSESSTSDGIIKVFEKAKKFQEQDDNDILSVVILDEIGLAEISRFNPLKVLHSLLEPEGKEHPDVAVVGISNWTLDAAKMNRAIHLSRPEMTVEELHETGVSIGTSLMHKNMTSFTSLNNNSEKSLNTETDDLLKCIAYAYSVYIKKQKFQNFHGLRDYYSLIKHLCRCMSSRKAKAKDTFLSHGLSRNFGGLPPSEAILVIKTFQENIANVYLNNDTSVDLLVEENLKDQICRHLMLITNGDAVINTLEQTLKKVGKTYVVMFGSQFQEDLTDDYNYRILSKIILCMEQGMVLILKDLENIYGSLYDMLNQNYTIVGNKRNCRVALGPYSNPMCYVHDNFKCIVLVESSKLDYSDPPFLNRFEKQQFRFKDLLHDAELEIIHRLMEFMESVSKVENTIFRQENCFPIHGEDMLSSLVLNVRTDHCSPDETYERCSELLLFIMFPDAVIRAERSSFALKYRLKVREIKDFYLSLPIHEGLNAFISHILKQKTTEEHLIKLPDDEQQKWSNRLRLADYEMFILFTHSNIHTNIHACLSTRRIQLEKLGALKSEKALTNRIQHFFDFDDEILVIQFNGNQDMHHFQLVKSALENTKKAKHTINESHYHRKIILVLVHISKDDSLEQNILPVNFMSGWFIATLDDLERPTVSLPDVIGMSLPEAINSHYNLNDYITQQLFWAFTRIQYTSNYAIEAIENHIENIKESENLQNIISTAISRWITSDKSDDNRQWQLHVACNAQLLQCSSTYVNALESMIKNVIKQPLAMFVFRLEEAGVLDSFFKDDENKPSRRKVWNEMIETKTFFDYENTPLPSGPECYSCNISSLQRDMPFGNTIFLRTEALRDNYLEMLRRVKISCDMEEDDEVSRHLLDEISMAYLDVVTANMPELLSIEYTGANNDYFHDFCNIITSTVVPRMTENSRVQAMQWALLNYIETLETNFTTFLTNLHVSYWTYSEKVLAIVKTFHISENAFGCAVINTIENINVSEDVAKKSILVAFGDHETDIQPNFSLQLDNSETKNDKCVQEDKLVYSHGQHLNKIKSEIGGSDSNDNSKDVETCLSTEELTPLALFSQKWNPTPDTEIGEGCDLESPTEKCDEQPKEQKLLSYICRKLLPTSEHLQSTSVLQWQRTVIRFLPLASTISYDLEEVQSLRFCNDFASIIVIPYLQDTKSFSTLGNSLTSNELATESFYHDVINVLKDLEVPTSEAQRVICLYAHRCIVIQNSFEVLEWLFSSIETGEMPDESLSFLGPILSLAIEEEVNQQSNVFQCVLLTDLTHLQKDGLLKVLDKCISNSATKNRSCSTLKLLVLDILVDHMSSLTNGDMDENTITDLALNAHTIYDSKECSLRVIVAVAFLRNFFQMVSEMSHKKDVFEENTTILNTANAILEACYDEERKEPNSLFWFFLKCFGKDGGHIHIRKQCSMLSNYIPVLAKLDWSENIILTALDFHPLPLHDQKTFQKFQNALKIGQEKEKKQFLKLLNKTGTDRNHLICLHALLLNRVLMRKAVEKVTDSDMQFVLELLKHVPVKTMPPCQSKILNLFSGKQDFHCLVFHLSPDSNEPRLHIASFLCHLLSIVTTFSVNGDTMYECVYHPKSCTVQQLPGFKVSNTRIHLKGKFVLCPCKTRYVSSSPTCPVCSWKKEVNSHHSEHSFALHYCDCYEIELRFLRLFIHACFLSSVAIDETNERDVKHLFEQSFHMDEQNSICDFLLSEIDIDWNYLKVSLAVSHGDLCCLLHIFIIKNRQLLANGPLSSCKSNKQKENFEEEFIKSMNEVVKQRRCLLNKYKKMLLTTQGLTNSKRCRLEGIESFDENSYTSPIPESCFSITGMPTTENFHANLLLQPVHQHPFLKLALRKMKELSACNSIMPILKWHLGVVALESYKIKRMECTEVSISKFLSRENDDKVRERLKILFESFMESWNKLRTQNDIDSILQSQNANIVKLELITANSMANDCLIVNPNSNIKRVLLALIQLQNNFLDDALLLSETSEFPSFNAMSYDKNTSCVRCVAVYDIENKDVIDFKWDENEFLRFSQRSTEKNPVRDIVYDFRKIEMELAHNILFGKAYITETDSLPNIIFSDELFRNCISLMDKVREKIPQQPLPSEILERLQNKKSSNPSHTNEMLTQVGIILSLLNKTGGDPTLPLVDYLEKWKGIIPRSAYKDLLPEPEHYLKLCHITTLYELLEEINGGDLGESLDDRFRVSLSNESNQQLQSIKAKHMKVLELVGRALKVYIHRNLLGVNNDLNVEKQLLINMKDPVYWKQGSLVDECVVVEHTSVKIPLNEVINPLLCVKHLHGILHFIKVAIEEVKETKMRILSITTNFQGTKHQTQGKSQRKISRKKLGKT